MTPCIQQTPVLLGALTQAQYRHPSPVATLGVWGKVLAQRLCKCGTSGGRHEDAKCTCVGHGSTAFPEAQVSQDNNAGFSPEC